MESGSKFTKYFETGEAREPRYGTLSLDVKDQTVINDETGEKLHLAPKEYQFLWLLIKAQGNPVQEDGFLSLFYDDASDTAHIPRSKVVYTYASQVRTKIENLTHGKMRVVNAGHEFGYRLVVASEM